MRKVSQDDNSGEMALQSIQRKPVATPTAHTSGALVEKKGLRGGKAAQTYLWVRRGVVRREWRWQW